MTKTKIIRISDIKIAYDGRKADYDGEAMESARRLIYGKTGVRPVNLVIAKKSVDARRMNGRRSISFVYSV